MPGKFTQKIINKNTENQPEIQNQQFPRGAHEARPPWGSPKAAPLLFLYFWLIFCSVVDDFSDNFSSRLDPSRLRPHFWLVEHFLQWFDVFVIVFIVFFVVLYFLFGLEPLATLNCRPYL